MFSKSAHVNKTLYFSVYCSASLLVTPLLFRVVLRCYLVNLKLYYLYLFIMSEKKIYGLTEEEATELESEDEQFYCIDEDDPPHNDRVSSVDLDLESDYEERASSTDSEVEDTINTFVNEQSSTPDASDSDGSGHGGGIICLQSDPLYLRIERILSAGCSCSLSCLSQFDTREVFLLHLALSEMEKSEKDMFLLGKLQAVSKTQDDARHARKAKPGKRKRVTCDYRFDGTRVFAKMAFCFFMTLEVNT